MKADKQFYITVWLILGGFALGILLALFTTPRPLTKPEPIRRKDENRHEVYDINYQGRPLRVDEAPWLYVPNN